MALEFGPQAPCRFRLETAQHRSPNPSRRKLPQQCPPLRFRPSAGPATPQQEPRRLVASAPNTQPQRRRTGCGARAAVHVHPAPRGGDLGLACAEIALGPRQPRDRTFTTAAPKVGCRTGAGVIGAALGLGIGACGPFESLPSRGFRD